MSSRRPRPSGRGATRRSRTTASTKVPNSRSRGSFRSPGCQRSSPSWLCNCGVAIAAVAVARQVLQVTDDQRGPSGLMTGAQTFASLAVEIFVEQNQVAPVRVFGPARVVSVARTASGLVGQENAGQPARQFARNFVQRQPFSGAGRTLH